MLYTVQATQESPSCLQPEQKFASPQGKNHHHRWSSTIPHPIQWQAENPSQAEANRVVASRRTLQGKEAASVEDWKRSSPQAPWQPCQEMKIIQQANAEAHLFWTNWAKYPVSKKIRHEAGCCSSPRPQQPQTKNVLGHIVNGAKPK